MSHPRSHPNTARTSRKAISLTNSEQLNAKSVKVNTHPKVNAPKLWAITLSFHQICFLPYFGNIMSQMQNVSHTPTLSVHPTPSFTSMPPGRFWLSDHAMESRRLGGYSRFESRRLGGYSRCGRRRDGGSPCCGVPCVLYDSRMCPFRPIFRFSACTHATDLA